MSKEWGKASTFLQQSLQRLGIMPRQVEEAMLKQELVGQVKKLFPNNYDRITVQYIRGKTAYLEVSDHYMAQEVRNRTTDILSQLDGKILKLNVKC